MFQHLLGGENDPAAEELYRWHIEKRSGARFKAGLNTDNWKRDVHDYVISAKGLLVSMQGHGFNEDRAIPIDPEGELLNGSHRLACAICLKLKTVPVQYSDKHAWAPDWGVAWFQSHGLEQARLNRLIADFYEMQR